MQKLWVKVAVGIVAAIILVLILVPLFINGDTFRPTLQSQLSSALGRKVTLGHVSFSLFSGGLSATDIAIADDPAFSSSPFLRAKELKVGVELGPFVFGRQVHITRLTLDDPAIQLIQNQAGRWNFSSLGGPKAAPSAPAAGSPSPRPDLTVGELQIKNGSASLSTAGDRKKPFVYSAVDVTVKHFSFANSFPFELSANLPGNGSLKLSGTAGPISEKDASASPFRANLHIQHLDPVAAGLVDRSSGISGDANMDADFASSGTALTAQGKIEASHLQLSRTGAPASQPVHVDFDIWNNLEARMGRVKDIAIHAGSAAAHVTGSYRMTPQAVVLDLKLNAPNLPVDQLEQFLPAFGVQLPSGSRLQGGTLTANLNITGPATATTIAGPAEIDNTKLAGFDLGSKIQGLNPFGGTGGGTQIQTLRAKLNASPQNTEITDIYANLPQVGTATGSGTVSPSGALNFHMVATLTSSNAAGQLANQAINQAKSFLGGFLNGGKKPAPSKAAQGIPLVITGTASSPTIRADVGKLLR